MTMYSHDSETTDHYFKLFRFHGTNLPSLSIRCPLVDDYTSSHQKTLLL